LKRIAFPNADVSGRNVPSRTTHPDRPDGKTEAMDPAEVERLKREWKDKRVAVEAFSSSLRRFAGRTGTVLTVNMNGRALVRFDGLADIGWYDLPMADLRPIAVPPPPEEVAPSPPGGPPVTSATAPKVEGIPTAAAPPPSAGQAKPKSILELARQQGGAKPKG
jgi:hypothetical protein